MTATPELELRNLYAGGEMSQMTPAEELLFSLEARHAALYAELSELEERLRVLREADTIVVSEMKASDWYYKVWQSFAVLLPVKSVGVMGDERTYDNCCALRVVGSQDGMTADWVRLPYDLLARISSRIVNEVKGINRCVLDITSKPPGTIEWE